MEIKDLIKFEPIDLTQILLTIAVVLIIIYAFKSQLNGFFDSLRDRPITVKMSGSETTIELDSPVRPELLAESIPNPQGSQQDIYNWEQTVNYLNNIEGFQKLGFNDLYKKLSNLDSGELAVINYEVNNPSKYYFKDDSMLRYLSIASEKIKYLAFYEREKFVAAIDISYVISGLSSGSNEFSNFGKKLKNGQWSTFPGLIKKENGFERPPSVKELYQYLSANNIDEAPLVQEGKLTGFLNFRSISTELYSQVSGG